MNGSVIFWNCAVFCRIYV